MDWWGNDMCDYGNFDAPDFLNQKIVKARKNHKCDECGTVIFKGDKYESIAGAWSGNFEVYKRCSFCIAMCEFISDEYKCSPLFGGLQYDYEHITHDLGDRKFYFLDEKQLILEGRR